MHALLLLGSLLLPQAVNAGALQAVAPESTLVARPVALPSYRLDRATRQEGPVEYSDAYGVRLQIHKLASFATVPLFVLQYLAGEELIEGEGGTLAGWHGGLAAGVAGLFAVNTITGGLNFLEARKDPEDRTRRTIHALLMLAADAGFVATGVAANSAGEGEGGTHRTLAIASMGVSLVSYAIMLPPFRKD